ncbi:SusD/RagB family nutrient-binding outer membrane lipoprotein [Hymenobacter sp. GOD-10R]|uniref:SusD/RagB family nutrient-binding outer membrane lipoprotein n=1 Tax=Hymenobacter sp. GOD-10R TaxID=3093922 RepID=UPI002D7990A6|nr:SusD/RagB family nutrient-binding outer membrane lipoprotein [Hymenobacter sp. GOD-10R]WRQ29900.1 SusD/RagB family nutrient-binding outer membrane lipoprotein [Hymenobacter sp. GOD-10R]
MKQTSFLRYSLAAVFAFAAASCDKDKFLDVNNNPNLPLTVPPTVLLTGAEASTGFVVGNELGRVTELFIQHTAGINNQPRTYDTYQIRGNYDNQWNNELYGGTLINLQQIINATQETSPAYAGAAKILKAYNFALTTDLWGDIPYSQALQGNLDAPNFAPRFDTQQDIYQGNTSLGVQSLFDLVKEGLADLDKTSVLKPGADDLVYQGNLTRWKKFGNTLLLKLANTISKKNPTLATSIINEVLAKGTAALIVDNADDFQVPYGTAVGNQNPFYAYNYVNRPDDQMMSQRFLDSLRVKDDPRLPSFFTTTPANSAATNTSRGIFTGYDNGSTATVPVRANRSRFSTYVIGTSGEAPVRLVTNFQRAFILAESALILKTAGDPQALFQEGIRASMAKAGISATDIAAYFTANPRIVILAGSDQHKLNQIITQKWIAWTGNGYEAYNDFRRTGYPRLALTTNPSSESPTSIPVRLYYPNVEISSNVSNIPTPQPLTNVPVWWDVP